MATYVGSAMPSTTNGQLAAGAGGYVADVTPAGCLHMALVRSPHARAAILSIDAERAAQTATVVTGAQLGLGPLPLSYVPEAVGVQALGVVTVAGFSAVATFVITKLADMLVGLRVDREHETLGLDFATHGETGYHMNR